MKLTSKMVEGFSQLILAKNFDDFKTTPDCHREWWEAFCMDHPLVALCAPRGHGKSTSLTHCYTLAACLFKDRKYVIIVSDTYEQAVLFLQDIKKELVSNEDLISLFKVEKVEKDAENDLIVRLADGYRFRITAKGAEQKMRGLKWDGRRPDLIICDDLENDEIVLNKERREKFRNWFNNALLPCRSDRGIVRMVGTILHLDSLLERLMPKDWDTKAIASGLIVKEPLRSYYNFKKRKHTWYSVRYRAHDETMDHILWPSKWTKERLKAERQRYVDMGSPEGYAQEYLNYPIDETFAYFRRSDFLPMGEADHQKTKRYYIAVDLAITEKSRSDFTVFAVGGMDEDGQLHIVNIVRDRLDAYGIVDMLFRLAKKYSPEMVTIEASMIEKAIGPFINETMRKKGEFFPLTTMVPTKDKEQRATSMQARMRAGGVKFDKQADWYIDLEQEMLQFPKSRHDDQVDALAWLGLTIDQMIEAPTAKEMEEEEYALEFSRSGWLDQGRSAMTGY